MNPYQQEFEEIYKTHITREGADKLLEWMRGTDFFTAPASTKSVSYTHLDVYKRQPHR